MLEKTIPWWRKALRFALGGIRSGFGLFSRPARLTPVTEPVAEPVAVPVLSDGPEKNTEEERVLTKPFPKIEVAAEAPEFPVEIETPQVPVAEPEPLPEPAIASGIAAGSELVAEPAPAHVPVEEEAALGDVAPTEAAPESEPEEGAEESEAEIEFSEERSAEAEQAAEAKQAAQTKQAAEAKQTAEEPPVLKGHDFSRAVNARTQSRALAPAEAIAETEPEQTSALSVEPEAVNDPNSEPVEEAEPVDEVFEAPLEVAEPVVVAEAAQDAVPEPDEEAEPAAARDAVPEPVSEADPVEDAVPESVEEAEPETADTPEALDVTASGPPKEPEIETEPEPEIEIEQEAETESEVSTAPVAASMIEQATPADEPEAAPVPEQVSVTEPTVEISPEMKPADIPATEAVAEPENAPEPVSEQTTAPDKAPPLVLTAEPSAEEKAGAKAAEKAAAKLAARQKKLDESAEQSPFSVFVGQVYDGPLDLLLDLIRKQDIDIYDIPIARITAQFLAYVNQLKAGDVDVAGEFIYTASMLIHIKSKMLLPRAPSGPEDVAEDPRRELVERLLEHERFKNAAQMLQEKQMLEAATWSNPGVHEFKNDEGAEPEIAADTVDLVRVFRDILERARNRPVLNVQEDSVTVGQMIQFLARRLTMEDKPVALHRLLSHTRSERALIAMFLALLEMVRLQAILLRQDRQFSEIFIKKHTGFDAVMNDGLGNARDDWR